MSENENPSDLVEVPNLAAALAAVQRTLPAIGKSEVGKVSGTTKENKAFSYEYRYADLASISAKVLPLLASQGLSWTTFPTIDRAGFVLRYMLLHESGERIEGLYPLGTPGQPQQMGSAITYARRYCLCAVTGVAPDEDDDGRSAASVEPPDPELEEARAKVRGAWQFQYGALVTREVAAAYRAYSQGGDLWQAAPGDLRKYAAYLSNLPKEDAGETPSTQAAAPDPAPKMSTGQRGLLFKLMGEIGLHDQGPQLQWINKQLGTEYESRSLITAADAKVLIDGLQKGIDAPPSEPA